MKGFASALLCIGLLPASLAYGQQCEHPIADLTKCKARTARKDHVKKVSNPPCGPDGNAVLGAIAPQGYNEASFKPACTEHDLCYDTCNSVKLKCDADFEKTMRASCVAAYPYPTGGGEDEGFYRRAPCFSRAHLYQRLVAGSSVGQAAYDDAQKETCECCGCGALGQLLVDEPGATLKLTGCFGDAQGKVTVGVTPLAVKSWASDAIVCTLPLTGPGSNGDVVVEVPSPTGAPKNTNVRQLTEWDIPLHYLHANAYYTGFKLEGSGSLRFRADVAAVVPTDGGVPFFPLRGLAPTTDSALPVTGMGSFPVGSTCSLVLTGSGIFPTTPTVPPTRVLGSMMKIDTSARTGSIGLAFGASAGAIPFKANYVGTSCPPVGEQTLGSTFGLLDGADNFPSPLGDSMSIGPIPAFAITFDSQFKLAKKTYSAPLAGGTLTVEWTVDVVPISPPK